MKSIPCLGQNYPENHTLSSLVLNILFWSKASTSSLFLKFKPLNVGKVGVGLVDFSSSVMTITKVIGIRNILFVGVFLFNIICKIVNGLNSGVPVVCQVCMIVWVSVE